MKKTITNDRKEIRHLINEFENFDATQHQEKMGNLESEDNKYKQEDVVFDELNTFLDFFTDWSQFEINVGQLLEKIKIQYDQHQEKINKKPEGPDVNRW